ncbi:MAG: SulP family inorganic anion transporter [Deltaproteobacteria bacterium]|nr:SulP family inorganic anion transporter [Deltaproteobacteria bacterium]
MPKNRVERWIPGLRMLREYRPSWFFPDLAAGVTLGAVMVPVGLAFGDLAGLPLAGLYAAMLPLLVYVFFGSSRQLIIGPDATMAAIVAVSIAPLAEGDVVRLAMLAGMLAVLIGLVCIFGSFLRLGFMADFLAKPVIVGFMHGLAFVIFTGQLPKILGIQGGGDTTLSQLVTVCRGFGAANGVTLTIGAACVTIILVCRHWFPRIPGQIVALLLALLAVLYLELERYGVSVVGEIPRGLPTFHLPIPSLADLQTLIPIAFAAALVAFSDTVVTARGFASRNRYQVDANQEMFALGIANIGSGLTQGIPVSGSGSRTAVAESTGSRTQVTSLVAAVAVGCVMLFLTPYLYHLPEAALGGILVAAAYNLCEFGEFRRMWRFRGAGFFGALLTFAGVVGIGVMQGIALGILYSLVLVLKALSFPDDAILGRNAEGEFHDLKRYPEAREIPGLILYRFSGPLFFANCGQFRSRVEGFLDAIQEPVKAVILDASGVINIDLAACELLSEIHEGLKNRGTRLEVANLRDFVKEQIFRGWEGSQDEPSLFFKDLNAAVEAVERV